jgi:hypothetical protein
MEFDCVIRDQLQDAAQSDVYLKFYGAKYYKLLNINSGKSVICTAIEDPNMAETQVYHVTLIAVL